MDAMESALDSTMQTFGLDDDVLTVRSEHPPVNAPEKNSQVLDDDDDDDDEWEQTKPAYVRPIFSQPKVVPRKPGDGMTTTPYNPFSFFQKGGALTIDNISGKPLDSSSGKGGRVYTETGKPVSRKVAERQDAASSVPEFERSFMKWANNTTMSFVRGAGRGVHKPGTGEPSVAPVGFVPKVREIERIFEDDEKYADLYATVGEHDEPLEILGIENLRTIDKWEHAEFPDALLQNIKNSRYPKPRQVQRVVMPLILDNSDLICCTPTGSGKTLAYLAPVIARCINDKKSGQFRPALFAPYAVVLTPTRELSHQIYEQALKLAHGTGVTVAKLYGEYAVRANCRELEGGCDLLFTTPGRFSHFFKNDWLFFKDIQFLIFDEADTLFTDSFLDDIEPVVRDPKFAKRLYYQTLFFSSAYSESLITMSTDYLNPHDAVSILSKRCGTSRLCVQEFQRVTKEERYETLKNYFIYKLEEVDNDPTKLARTLVFVNSQILVDELAGMLVADGLPVTRIRGNFAQNCRMNNFNSFRSNTFPIMITTDLCARGIDIKDVDLVLNYELPRTVSTYIYRVGRVGRIKEGHALSYVDPYYGKYVLPEILQILKVVHHPVSANLDEIMKEIETLKNSPADGFDEYFGDQQPNGDAAGHAPVPFANNGAPHANNGAFPVLNIFQQAAGGYVDGNDF